MNRNKETRQQMINNTSASVDLENPNRVLMYNKFPNEAEIRNFNVS